MVALTAGKYRNTQPYLFQSVSEKYIRTRLAGQADHPHDNFGPTYKYVDFLTGWPWTRPGGDWVDADGVRHGTKPWFSVLTQRSTGATQIVTYTADATTALAHCFTNSRWCAFRLASPNAARTLASSFNSLHAGPSLNVTYADGSTATLRCRLMAANTSSSQGPITTAPTYSLPAFLEFERPTKAVRSAEMSFVVTEHWSGNNPAIEGFLVDPPMNTEAPRQGLAANLGALDAGLQGQTSVLGVHRYLDGTSITDFVHPGGLNYNDEANFDPAIYGLGPTDLTKLPHLGLGKWINTNNNWSLVRSNYQGEGFAPLAPGLGAMRIKMPADPLAVDGGIVGSSGTLATTSMIYLPEPLFGRLDRIFVRYYFRLGGPYQATKANRKQVRHEAGQNALWTTMAGKFGISPTHANSYGGVSGTSGGPYGWQMRHSWYDCDAEMGGPDEGGWAAGYHLYDYLYQNPQGYNYGGPDGSPEEERWGQRGGLGGMMYAGHWYCVETELDLNTIGDAAPGFVPDGAIRTWIDGRLVYERTGMVFRSGPVFQAAPMLYRTRPVRELGVRGLWLDWFHGGKTLSSFDRVSFYTGLAYGTEYIGPMKQP